MSEKFILRATALAAAVTLPVIARASGEVIAVTAGDDSVDFGGGQQVINLPGPDGLVSLREAITAANNTPGEQTIRFAIARNRWWSLFNDRCIIPLDYALWVNGADTTIDFASQRDLTGDTNPTGNEVGLYYVGPPTNGAILNLNADRCTVRGMDMGRGNMFGGSISIQKNGCRVVGCTTDSVVIQAWGASASGNIIGGTLPGEGNTIFEIGMYSGASNNTVFGNILSHVRIAGDSYYGSCNDNRIGGPSAAERNVVSGYGYYGEEGFPVGNQVEVSYAARTLIEGNYIGTNAAGTASAGQRGPGGVEIATAAVDTVIRGNLISGLRVEGINHYQGQVFGVAVSLLSSATGTVIQGNRIGTDAAGIGVIGNVQGLVVGFFPGSTPLNTTIGGTAPGEGNVITASEQTGILVDWHATTARISGNSIYANGTVNPLALGIDLQTTAGVKGVTLNDDGDGDTGANNLQNFPVLSAAEFVPGGVRLAGTLSSEPLTSYRVEFFASPACHPTGYGEGRDFLGFVDVTTDAAGSASFSSTIAGSVPAGWHATATATHQSRGATSEFSACLAITGGSCPADFDGSGFADTDDFDAFVRAFEAGGDDADFDGSGFVDTDDFDAFVLAFEAGC
ncbi:MAG: hypothetical protein AMXMBFR58_28980 [Phycisphaerae bacterium]